MITLQCQLEFQNKQDKEIVLDLMRKFSSAMRYAYQRLLEGEKRKDLKKHLSKLFSINTRYSDDAIFLAQSMITSCKEREQNPKKLIFGSRKLFEQLKKNHLTGKRRKQLKTKWKESRQGNLYSRGDKTKQGNLNLRFQWINDELYLRINTGDRQYIYAKVIRSVERKNDKWIEFMFMLENAYRYGEWFPYSVNLKIKNSNVYAFISVEEKLPHITIKKDNGIIGIDVNAYPFHLALAFTLQKGKRGLGFKEKLPKNYKELLNDSDFLSCTIARIEDNIKKLKQKLKEEKNEYKRNKIKSILAKLRKNLKTLQKHVSRFTSHVSRLESGKSESSSQQPVNQWKEQVRGLPAGRHKSWQVLSIALAFCCLERSYRDFSPLKRVIISKDWIAVANRLVPVLGTGAMTLPKYRLLGSEVSEMAEYKYPNPSCASFIQFG